MNKYKAAVSSPKILTLLVIGVLSLITVISVREQQSSRTSAQAVPTNAVLQPTFGALGPCPSCETPSIPVVSGYTGGPTSGAHVPISTYMSQAPQAPCDATSASLADHKKKKKSKHKKHEGGISKGIEAIFKFLIELLNLLLKLFGGGEIKVPQTPAPGPIDSPDIEAPEEPESPEEPEVSESPEPCLPSESPKPSGSMSQPSVFPSQSSGLPSSAPSGAPAPSGAAAAAGKRNIPVAPEGSLGQFNLSSKEYIMAFRFVLDQPAAIDRWYFAINGEGASCVGGRTGYGSGNGGTEFGRIVEVDQATGFPTATVLGQESVNGCTAHERSITEFGLTKTHQAHFVQFAPVNLQAGKMYAFLLSNTDASPGNGGSSGGGNHMSPNLNFGKLADMGPHAKNTLDANAPGAAYGYDPRETTMWSKDGGKTWLFGDQVGWYQNGSGEGRMWVVGYRSGGKNVPHGYTYMNWPSNSTGASVTYKNVPKAVTLTHAGGAGSGVGVVTVTNTSTGVSATTQSLASGMVSGPLSQPVQVAAGQSYTIKASGSVETGSASFWDKIFGLGANYTSTCSSCSKPSDLPALFVLPHPYY